MFSFSNDTKEDTKTTDTSKNPLQESAEKA